MIIKFLEDYKFYKAGYKPKLHNFTVLTGENGAGKTNLLLSIRSRRALVDEVRYNNEKSIIYYNYNSLTSVNRSHHEKWGTRTSTVIDDLWQAYLLFL